MADTKSNGLIGLSHFKNSRISSDLMEPVYLNIFTVQISLPSAIGATEQDTNLLLEGVQRVGGLDTNKTQVLLLRTINMLNVLSLEQDQRTLISILT